MTKYRIVNIILVIGIMLFFVACSSKKEGVSGDFYEKSPDTQIQESSIPSGFNTTIKGTKFQIKNIEIPKNIETQKILKCDIAKEIPEIDQIINHFSKNQQVEQKWEQKTVDEDGNTCRMYTANYKNGNYLNVYNGSILWNDQLEKKISASFDTDNKNRYEKEKVFTFGDTNYAKNKILKLAEKCGYEIKQYDTISYALDHQTMQKLEVHEDKEGNTIYTKSDWSEADDCYAIYFEQYNQNIPVYFGQTPFLQDDDPTMWPMNGIVSKNGVDKIQISKWYIFKEKKQMYRLKNFTDCANTVAEKYGRTLSDTTYTVERAKLYWIPIKREGAGYEAKLSWLFEIIESGKDKEMGEYKKKLFTIIDAETGKEIVL